MNEAIAPQSRAGRRVVLKLLDEDCLLDGQLHPSIRQRLERVRELPLRGVANLLGVERGGGDGQETAPAPVFSCLVWEYVPGKPLKEVEGDEATWRRICREVILSIEALHSTGIVHGAIHARNVIINEAGEIRLTHVSPLLYSDPDQDQGDAIRMLRELVTKQLPDSQLALDLDKADSESWRLSDLYAQLGDASSAQPDAIDGAHDEPGVRVRAVLFAGISALAGMGIVFGILWYLGWRWAA
jgi:serine/threonine protein kinase